MAVGRRPGKKRRKSVATEFGKSARARLDGVKSGQGQPRDVRRRLRFSTKGSFESSSTPGAMLSRTLAKEVSFRGRRESMPVLRGEHAFAVNSRGVLISRGARES